MRYFDILEKYDSAKNALRTAIKEGDSVKAFDLNNEIAELGAMIENAPDGPF